LEDLREWGWERLFRLLKGKMTKASYLALVVSKQNGVKERKKKTSEELRYANIFTLDPGAI